MGVYSPTNRKKKSKTRVIPVAMATCEDGHGGGLSRPVVAQQGSDLSLVHVEAQVVHSLLRCRLLEGQQVQKALDQWLQRHTQKM